MYEVKQARARQDSSIARANSEQKTAMQRQDQVKSRAMRRTDTSQTGLVGVSDRHPGPVPTGIITYA